MHDAIQRLTGFLLYYLTHSVVALLLVAVAASLGDRAMRRVGPLAQHRMWVCALLGGIALPMLPTNLLQRLVLQPGGDKTAVSIAVDFSHVIRLRGPWALSSSVASALVFAYLLSVLFGLTRLLWRWRRTRELVRGSVPVKQPRRIAAVVREVARRLAVAEPEIRCSPRVNGPVVFGRVVVVPGDFFDSGRIEDISAALAHECAHIARRDCTLNMLYEFVAVLVTYHPACWWIRRRLAETRELVCDERAAAAVADRCRYASSLLRLATAMADRGARTPIHAIGVFDANILEERIMRLTKDIPKLTNAKRVLLVGIATCALLGSAVSATAMGFDVSPQHSNTTVYKIGYGVSAPVLIHSVDPQFSDKARRAKYQGICVVSLIVDTHGNPQNIKVVRALGMGLDRKAMEAVKQYKFKPAMRHGKPVAVAIDIEVNFRVY